MFWIQGFQSVEVNDLILWVCGVRVKGVGFWVLGGSRFCDLVLSFGFWGFVFRVEGSEFMSGAWGVKVLGF